MNGAGPLKLFMMSFVGFLLILAALSGKVGSIIGAIIDPASMIEGLPVTGAGTDFGNAPGAQPQPLPGPSTIPKTGVLSDKQLATVASTAGFRGQNLITAIAIAIAESGGNPTATHLNTDGSTDRGLWQINSVHKQFIVSKLFDPTYNASAAYTVSGGSNFGPWTTFTTGKYRAFLPRAGIAVHT